MTVEFTASNGLTLECRDNDGEWFDILDEEGTNTLVGYSGLDSADMKLLEEYFRQKFSEPTETVVKETTAPFKPGDRVLAKHSPTHESSEFVVRKVLSNGTVESEAGMRYDPFFGWTVALVKPASTPLPTEPGVFVLPSDLPLHKRSIYKLDNNGSWYRNGWFVHTEAIEKSHEETPLVRLVMEVESA